MVALASVVHLDSDAAVILLVNGCWPGSSSSCPVCALLQVARSILRAFLLAFTKIIIIMDVKTITDIVKPIASVLVVAIAPVHLELITVAAGKELWHCSS